MGHGGDTLTLAERAAAMVEVARKRELQNKADNRRLMPQSYQFIQDFKAVFGGPFPYGRFEEGGRVVQWGTPPERRGK